MRDEQWMDLAVEAGQLREALASRAPIEQAKGIVMLVCSTDPEQAYQRIRDASMRRNIKVAALAAAIVDLCANPSPIFTQTQQPTLAHGAAFELLEEWGMDFGHLPTTGMDHPFAPTQRDVDSPRPVADPSTDHDGPQAAAGCTSQDPDQGQAEQTPTGVPPSWSERVTA